MATSIASCSAMRASDRAALRWFMLSAMVGTFTFVVFTFGSRMFGVFPPMQQGYAFGFFLAMYLGLALGVGRYHLFDLDRWPANDGTNLTGSERLRPAAVEVTLELEDWGVIRRVIEVAG